MLRPKTGYHLVTPIVLIEIAVALGTAVVVLGSFTGTLTCSDLCPSFSLCRRALCVVLAMSCLWQVAFSWRQQVSEDSTTFERRRIVNFHQTIHHSMVVGQYLRVTSMPFIQDRELVVLLLRSVKNEDARTYGSKSTMGQVCNLQIKMALQGRCTTQRTGVKGETAEKWDD
ncbi:hypothetical protein BC832DRAFT_123066 [Gaertneriomyces semiglobifer]|nr:hypothetical protein BC832DRAFT_123066 [Gaertneriomyces semiglobifer]